jgi:hypothetical protein
MLSNAVFFAAVPALAALYMLKLNRRNKKIPSLYFIKKLISDNKGSSLFKKLTSNMLLFLEIIFLIILALVLMNPGRPGQSALKKKLVLLIDNSITMSSRDAAGGRPRLYEAVEEAIRVIYSNANSSVSVIEFSDTPKLLLDSEVDRSEAALKIKSISPTHLAPDYKTAVALAEGLSGEGEYPEIHIFSDFSSWRESGAAVSGKIAAVFHKTGHGGRNIGITALEVSEADEGGSAVFNIFYSVKNYCDYEVSIPASIFIDGARVSSGILTVAGGGEEAKIFKKYGAMPSNARVEIITSDILPADDKRVWSSSEQKIFKALIMSPAPYFYKAAVESAGKVICDSYERNVPKALYRQRDYDLVIIDDSAEALFYDKYKCRNFIVIEPPEGFAGLACGAGAFDLTVKTPDFPFAYMRSVDLSDLYIYKMKKAALNSNFSQIVYSSSAFALFALVSSESRSVFTVFFDPKLSNFPLKISFPIFFCNVINIIKSKKITGDNFFAGRQNYFNTSKYRAINNNSDIYFKYEPDVPAAAGDFMPPEINLNASDPAAAHFVKAPRFTLAGLYRAFDRNDKNASGRPAFDFYVNPPALRNLTVKPALPALYNSKIKPGEKAASSSNNGPAVPAGYFERTHISYAAPLLMLAVIILLLDWIYQNFRTFYRREGSN